MARPLRIEYENAYYHVMNRGRARQTVFPGSPFYEAFLQSLEEANVRFGVEVHAYCLMGNHYHLLLKTPRGNLGRAMRHIDGVYTQRHNRLKRTDGPLFRGRYKAIVIDASSYLLQVSRYIHRNPIETQSPLVDDLVKYPWSSYSAYLNKIPIPVWLNRDAVFGELGHRQRYSAYRRYVEAGNDQETTLFYGRSRLPPIMGDNVFKERVLSHSPVLDEEVDQTALAEPVPVQRIINAVANFYQLSVESLCHAKRGPGGKNTPRWVAMKLAQDLGGVSLKELARIFNVGHYSTISQTVGRLNKLLEEDPGVAKEINMISQDLTP